MYKSKRTLKHEVKLKLLHAVMRKNVWVQFVDYDNEEEVMRQDINTFHD